MIHAIEAEFNHLFTVIEIVTVLIMYVMYFYASQRRSAATCAAALG